MTARVPAASQEHHCEPAATTTTSLSILAWLTPQQSADAARGVARVSPTIRQRTGRRYGCAGATPRGTGRPTVRKVQARRGPSATTAQVSKPWRTVMFVGYIVPLAVCRIHRTACLATRPQIGQLETWVFVSSAMKLRASKSREARAKIAPYLSLSILDFIELLVQSRARVCMYPCTYLWTIVLSQVSDKCIKEVICIISRGWVGYLSAGSVCLFYLVCLNYNRRGLMGALRETLPPLSFFGIHLPTCGAGLSPEGLERSM